MRSLICIFAFGLVIAGAIQGLRGIEERIFRGDVATRGQVSWITYLNITMDNGQTGSCAGTLISKRWAITSAHCVQEAKSIDLFLGMQRTDDENGTMKFTIEKDGIHLYPTWNPLKGTDNLALLKLPSDVDLYKYEYVDFIRLPLKANASEYDFRGAVASGWGYYNRERVNSVELRYANVRIMPDEKCRKIMRPFDASGELLCVKNTHNKGPCFGDEGGPLTLNLTNGDPILVGVNSFGGCSAAMPSIYSFIGYDVYLDWIFNTAGIPSLGEGMGPTTTTQPPK